jgi:hypothetical protein
MLLRMSLLYRTLLLAALSASAVGAEIANAPDIRLTGRPGLYTTEQWRRDWPGCTFEAGVAEKRVTLTEHDGHRWLRVAFQPGAIGPDDNGAGWRAPFRSRDTAELSYRLRFAPDFEWVKGGKLPGLAGGPRNVSGGRRADGTNGWSARLMWRADGRGEAYVYHQHQPGDYGESFPFPKDFRFPTDAPIAVRIRVTMNRPGQRDGTLRVWLAVGAGPVRLMVKRTNLAWRSVPTFAVDSLYFETFYGGSGLDWAPTRPGWAEFGDFRVK